VTQNTGRIGVCDICLKNFWVMIIKIHSTGWSFTQCTQYSKITGMRSTLGSKMNIQVFECNKDIQEYVAMKDTSRNLKYTFSCNFIVTNIKINHHCQLYFNCMNIPTSRQLHLIHNFIQYLIVIFILCYYMYGQVRFVTDSPWRWLT